MEEIMLNQEIETIPVGALGLVPLASCEQLAEKVNHYLVEWREEKNSEHKDTIAFAGYQRDSYIIKSKISRFGSGEAKGQFEESIRGDDLYVMVDVCNYSLTYSLYGITNHMSPDDHFQDLKRIIAAAAGKARRINVIMPFLFYMRVVSIKRREESLWTVHWHYRNSQIWVLTILLHLMHMIQEYKMLFL